MKTNHRRKNPTKSGYDYSYLNYCARFKVGLGADHDGGHKGSAKDIKEVKTQFRRRTRRLHDSTLRNAIKTGEHEGADSLLGTEDIYNSKYKHG